MAHWAEVDEDNIVTRVIVGDNNDPNGDEGYQWIINNLGGRWIKTSYNGNIRKNYAGVGYSYNEDLDAFIPPKPYESWTLNEDTALWDAPVDYPNDGELYMWNEETTSWQLLEPSE
jgi:hypothetical protein